MRVHAIDTIKYNARYTAQNIGATMPQNLRGQNNYVPISREHLAFLGHPNAYYELDTQQRCTTGNFKIKQLKDLPCACCGKEMHTTKEVDTFVYMAANAHGDELKEILESKLKYMRPIEEEVVKILCSTIDSKPTWSLSKLVKYQRGKHIGHLHNTQHGILSKMERKAEFFDNESDRHRMNNFIAHTREDIKCSTKENLFKRKTFLQELEEFGKTLRDKKVFEEIYKIAQTLPASTDSLSAFFVKYSQRNPKEIAYRLIIPSISTAEHIKPQSKEGEDKISNYIAECAYCNSGRGNMPLDKWVELNPQMPQNVDEHLLEVYRRFKNGELDSGYKNYFIRVANTLKTQSNGLINPNVYYATSSYQNA